ncbi:MAG: reverse transcriptase domain-containing protein [Melioribacteraceae bacterium]
MITNKYDLDTFLNYFTGREDFIAVQGRDYYYPINHTLDESIVKKHIDGIETFGVYVLNNKSQCNFICIDIDIDKNELSKINFTDPQTKFDYLKNKLVPLKELLENQLFNSNNILYEDSGGRGYHIWIFFDKSIDGQNALILNEIIKKVLDFTFEYFPKQPLLTESRKYGNLIKLPLGEHKKYNKRSSFFTFDNHRIGLIEGIKDNIAHLERIVKVKQDQFNQVIEKHKISIRYDLQPFILEQYRCDDRIIYKKDFNKLYSQCSAISSLKNKALSGETLNHFELFYLSSTLLSVEDSNREIHSIIKSSLKEKYSYEITEKELQSIVPLHPANCKTLIEKGICEGYCKEEFRNKNEDPYLKNTSPLHSLVLIKEKKIIDTSRNLLDEISNPENIRLAFYRLREYHKNEDVLFFDEFDFEFFEEDFNNNIQQISIVLKNKIEIPIVNYEKVNIPKKFDDNRKKVYRQLAYSSVFDQIIIQSIFNVIGEILEYHFEDNSYGYRLNVKDKKSNNIFEDWRDKYPDFRNTILNKLREPEIKYYICCDLKGYYDNINKDLLKTQLRSIINDDYIFSLLKQIIDAYSFNENENLNLGLPQGPAYARALSNLYLNKFDQEIIEKANYYYRYVDDFFILLDDIDHAKEIMEWIVSRLGDLGLRLSDGDKEANIIDSNDESILQDKIDSVRYGLFEDFKFLPNLSKQQIQSFYDTIIKKTFNANDKNKEIPTLIYFSTSPNIDDQRKRLIIDIIEELAKENSFFPKKVKKIFPPLLDLYESLKQDIIPFFNVLEETDKAFFLLALYKKYLDYPVEYVEKLKQVLQVSLASENIYFLGFGLTIYSRNKELVNLSITPELIVKINSYNSVFLENKLYRIINYFDAQSNIQTEIDIHFKSITNYQIKKGFLSGIRNANNITEQDNELIQRILSSNCHLLHSECCRIISLIRTKQPILESLVKFIEREKPKYNTFISDLFGKRMYEENRLSDDRKLSNLMLLFKDQCIEIVNIIAQIQSRVKNTYSPLTLSYLENYNQLESYNDCSYYVSNKEANIYREIIPFKDGKWYENLKLEVDQLCENVLIPRTVIDCVSAQSIVILSSDVNISYKRINDFSFSVNNSKECYNIFCLINNIYKKAYNYFTITGKIPLIEHDNIKIVDDHFNIVFLKKGKDIPSQYFCGNENVDSSKPENIIKLLFNFMFTLLFQNTRTMLDQFTDQIRPKIGIQLFIDYLLKRLKNGDISVERLSYLNNLIEKENVEDTKSLSFIYYCEKIKSNLFKNCEHNINWKGIVNGMVELYQDFTVTYPKINFRLVSYKNGLFLNKKYPSNLNALSKIVININYNLMDILDAYRNEFYLNSFQLLNLFGAYSLELHSLYKILLLDRKKIRQLSEKITSIDYGALSLHLLKNEIQSINRLLKVFISTENYVFKNSSIYTLKEMGILCLLVNLDYRVINNKIIISKCVRRQDEDLVDLFINLNPKIEEYMYRLVLLMNDSLKNSYKQPDIPLGELKITEESIIESLFLINKFRKRWRIKRGSSKYRLALDNKHFVLINTLNRGRKEVPVLITSNNPFTDTSYLYEKNGNLWYESKKRNIFNIIVPNQRITLLHEKLKDGKIFGYKYSLNYHDKRMLILDFLILILLAVLYAYLTTLNLHDITLGIVEVFKIIFWGLIPFFSMKCLYDLKFWIKGFNPYFFSLKKDD